MQKAINLQAWPNFIWIYLPSINELCLNQGCGSLRQGSRVGLQEVIKVKMIYYALHKKYILINTF